MLEKIYQYLYSSSLDHCASSASGPSWMLSSEVELIFGQLRAVRTLAARRSSSQVTLRQCAKTFLSTKKFARRLPRIS